MKILGILIYDVLDYRGKWFSTIDEHRAQTVASAMNGRVEKRLIPE